MHPPHNPGIEQAERRAGQQDLFPEKDRKGDPPDIAMTGGPPRRTTIRVQIVVSRPDRNAVIAPKERRTRCGDESEDASRRSESVMGCRRSIQPVKKRITDFTAMLSASGSLARQDDGYRHK
jgi:hypothetical protein